MSLHFVLELLCSIILATDNSWHSASLINLGSAESRHSHAHGHSRPCSEGFSPGTPVFLPP